MAYNPKITLKTRLLNYIQRQRGWTIKGDLEDYTRALGYLPDNGSRRLRELCKDGLIVRKLEKGQRNQKLVWYKRIWKNQKSNVLGVVTIMEVSCFSPEKIRSGIAQTALAINVLNQLKTTQDVDFVELCITKKMVVVKKKTLPQTLNTIALFVVKSFKILYLIIWSEVIVVAIVTLKL